MRFSVDPWDPGFGTGLEAELGESTAEIDIAVERPAGAWAPVDPPVAAEPATVLFVDGVRRVDAQVWIDEPDGTASPALCASYAAGVVCCRRGEARLRYVEVRRALVTTATGAADLVTAVGTYQVVRTAARADEPPAQVLSEALQRALRGLELEVTTAAWNEADELLVVDGPLRGRRHPPRALGFVKTHRNHYLPAALGAVVAQLGSAQRTPVFRLGSSWSRYTWYLRLPVAARAPWAGVVRVESGAELAPGDAVALAGLSQVLLPRYASAEHKDSRAPQNLYPIAGLERALRRRLGEPGVLYRALRRAAAAA